MEKETCQFKCPRQLDACHNPDPDLNPPVAVNGRVSGLKVWDRTLFFIRTQFRRISRLEIASKLEHCSYFTSSSFFLKASVLEGFSSYITKIKCIAHQSKTTFVDFILTRRKEFCNKVWSFNRSNGSISYLSNIHVTQSNDAHANRRRCDSTSVSHFPVPFGLFVAAQMRTCSFSSLPLLADHPHANSNKF